MQGKPFVLVCHGKRISQFAVNIRPCRGFFCPGFRVGFFMDYRVCILQCHGSVRILRGRLQRVVFSCVNDALVVSRFPVKFFIRRCRHGDIDINNLQTLHYKVRPILIFGAVHRDGCDLGSVLRAFCCPGSRIGHVIVCPSESAPVFGRIIYYRLAVYGAGPVRQFGGSTRNVHGF